jgi:CBS domain-containing protein
MDNNELFMQSFNNIEKKLRDDIDAYNNVPFYELVDKNAKKNKLIRQFNNELKTMGDLRNFIVHGDILSPMAIASEITVNRINFIEKQLTNPMKITELFEENVVGVNEDDSLSDLLKLLEKKRYSQYPVINQDGLKGLITENGIANWLANNIEKDIISIKKTTVKDVIVNEEERESYSILYSHNTLYDVIEKFEKGRNIGKRIFIIIVLKGPQKNIRLEDIYTIITPWDLDLIYNNLGLEF